MRSHELTADSEPQSLRSFALILDTGDEFMAAVSQFASERHLTASHFSAIGAFERLTLGYFEWSRKDYRRIEMHEQVEVVSLLGDIALSKGKPSLHCHVVVAKSDASAWGGHLLEAIVRPTIELVITETPAALHRRHDPATGLALIRP